MNKQVAIQNLQALLNAAIKNSSILENSTAVIVLQQSLDYLNSLPEPEKAMQAQPFNNLKKSEHADEKKTNH